jgi:hypothetical protein
MEIRIKADLLFCFENYALYKNLKIKIKQETIDILVQKAIDEIKQVQQLIIPTPKINTY